MKYAFDCRAPIIRTEQILIGRRADIRGLDTYEYVEFEQEVSWIRTATAKSSVGTAAAPDLRGGGTYSDHRQYLGCIDDALEDTLKLVEPFGIEPGGKIQARLQVVITDRPVVGTSEAPFYKGAGYARWTEAPKDWRIGGKDAAQSWDRRAHDDPEFDYQTGILIEQTVLDASLWTSAMIGMPAPDQVAQMMESLAPAFAGHEAREFDISPADLVKMLTRVVSDSLAVPA